MGTERTRELRRRRHRKKKVLKLVERAGKSGADKEAIFQKIRRLTPGADVVIANHGLDK